MASINADSGNYGLVGSGSFRALVLGVAVGSYALTGTDVTFGHGLTANSGSYSITGQSIQTARIAAFPTGYLIQGQNVTLTVGGGARFITATNGSYAYTGTLAILEKAVPQTIGSYGVTGTAVTLTSSEAAHITANSGVYLFTTPNTPLVYTRPIDSGDYEITGQVVTFGPGIQFSALSTNYTFFGTPAILAQSRHVPHVSGIYGITGSNTNLAYSANPNRSLVADSGLFVLSGQAAGLVPTRLLTALTTSYTLTGQSVNSSLFGTIGHYTHTGTPVTFIHTPHLIANGGIYTITGTPDTVIRVNTFTLHALSDTYTISGFASQLITTHFLPVDIGVYVYTGLDQELRATRIQVDPGQYSLTGTPVNFIPSHIKRWKPQPVRPRTNKTQSVIDTTWDPQSPGPGVT